MLVDVGRRLSWCAGRTSAPSSTTRSARRRRGLLPAIVMVAVAALPGVAVAQSDSTAERAAREIQEARDRANAAAEAYFEAVSELESLEQEMTGLERQEALVQTEVDELRGEVESIALSRYVASGTAGIPLLTEVTAPQDQIQAEVYVDVMTTTGVDIIDEFEAAKLELRRARDDVAAQRREIEEQRELHARLRDDANDEVERLRAIEQERLQDEAVQRALVAQLAKERARLEEQARLDAEAAARAQPNPGLVVPSTTTPPESTTTAPRVADDENALSTSATSGDDDTGDGPDGGAAGSAVPNSSDTADSTVPETSPPVSTVPPDSGASGGTSGGRTGVGGAGSAPPAPVSPGAVNNGVYVDTIVCPIVGSAYADTWGAPRSGGRRHLGVDMIAPRGVPILAVVDGTVTFKPNRLGGLAASLVGDNGNRYYYGHMDSYEGDSPRRVVAGEVIAYNGDTGNAKFSTPHLHFELRPGGGLNVNPYPSVRAAGC